MKLSSKTLIRIIVVCVPVIAILIGLAIPVRSRPLGDYSNVDGLIVEGFFGTATPQIVVKPTGGNVALEVQNSGGTPVYQVNSAGGVAQSGGQSGITNLVVAAPTGVGTATPAALINNAGVSKQVEVQDGGVVAFDMLNGGGARFTAPTAIATGQPGFQVDSNGVSNSFEVRDNATPVVQVYNGGGVIIAAPTAITTPIPAAIIDSDGVSNLLEVRDAATPVFTVNNGGGIVGQVMRYSTANTELVQGSQTVTDTATASHGLSTSVAFADCALAAAPTGDAEYCVATVSGTTVTLNVFQSNATPTANTAGILVRWVVIGVP
jgi:hypothetical protein